MRDKSSEISCRAAWIQKVSRGSFKNGAELTQAPKPYTREVGIFFQYNLGEPTSPQPQLPQRISPDSGFMRLFPEKLQLLGKGLPVWDPRNQEQNCLFEFTAPSS